MIGRLVVRLCPVLTQVKNLSAFLPVSSLVVVLKQRPEKSPQKYTIRSQAGVSTAGIFLQVCGFVWHQQAVAFVKCRLLGAPPNPHPVSSMH